MKVPSFVGNILGQRLAIGLLAPAGKPFSLFVKRGSYAQFLINLQWCQSGTPPATLLSARTLVRILE